jgi:uncharacterized membrane protein
MFHTAAITKSALGLRPDLYFSYSWSCYVQVAASGLRFNREWIARKYDDTDSFVRFMLALGFFLFQGLEQTGTLFFCLVVKAYVPAIGWTAFGLTSIFLSFSLGLWIYQLCKEISTQRKKRGEEEQDSEGNNQAGQAFRFRAGTPRSSEDRLMVAH